MKLGAHLEADGTRFSLFTNRARACSVRLFDESRHPLRTVALEALADGVFSAHIAGVGHGARYKFVLDDHEYPDPYARFLPNGVHGPAMVFDSSYRFEHARPAPRPLSQQVVYELHLGTFTPEGTYAAASGKLAYLSELGITTVELMPLSAFAGEHGWGYDGVAHFAPHAAYGDPDSLRRFIDTAHGHGLAVILDVVYNHFDPSGNYLGAYASDYFTDQFHNAWGPAPHFGAAAMRSYVIDNTRYWIEEFLFDGFRFDATHAIFDPSPRHVLHDASHAVRLVYPHALLFAEDERNDPECLSRFGVDGLWADDFHHQLRVTLTGEQDGYYSAYTPGTAGLARVIERGWLFEGQHYAPKGAPRGKSAAALPPEAFLYCIQNHDQIGNRALGTRLNHEVELDAYCMATSLLLFLPMTPLLFMGQEWAATTPFLYFTDHDPELGALVTAGRLREFAHFEAFATEAGRAAIPDPQARTTFERSKLDWDEHTRAPHERVHSLVRVLLILRRQDPVLGRHQRRDELSARAHGQVLAVRRGASELGEQRVLFANFSQTPVPLNELPWFDPAQRVLVSSGANPSTELGGHTALIVSARAG